MKKKRVLDFSIAAISLTISALLYFYMESGDKRTILLLSFSILSILFFLLGVFSKQRVHGIPPAFEGTARQSKAPTELALLGEEDAELAVWDLYGKAGLVIGRDVGENHVDVDLNGSAYAGMIDVEHAVLNYAGGYWYVEDLGSKNGISVQKFLDGRKYKLSSDKPCKLEKGDILYIGLARLLLR